nr:MAG TPA: hypothetical protein [Caudoviricetes sp.]
MDFIKCSYLIKLKKDIFKIILYFNILNVYNSRCKKQGG